MPHISPVKVEEWKRTLAFSPRPLATIDFETKSAADIRKVGAWNYSKHKTTDALCMAWHVPGHEDVNLWHNAHPTLLIDKSPYPTELFEFVAAGGLVEAHNVFFEKCIWRNVMMKKHGWPDIPDAQWRCSAAKASMCALPRDLEDACRVAGVEQQKDTEGKKVMLRLSKPRAPRKDEITDYMILRKLDGDYKKHKAKPAKEGIYYWNEEIEDVKANWEYCKQDVRAEKALSEVLPDLPPRELAVWEADQRMNWKGIRFDLEFARAALVLADKWRGILNAELYELTGIEKATARQRIRDWLDMNEGLSLPDTAAETLDFYLDEKRNLGVSGRARRVMEIMRQVNKTSVAKYKAMLERADPEDGRARDMLMYHGASTGRWTGKGIQVQNLPRGNVKDMDRACDDIMGIYEKIVFDDMSWKAGLGYLFDIYGDVIELLSGCIRGAIIASDNRDIMVADYAAIEARCVLWEADQTDALVVFYEGGDIYCDMASGIYQRPINKHDDPGERQFGKQAILGLGYGMGFVTFLLTCRRYGIYFTDAQVRQILGRHYKKYMQYVVDYFWPVNKDGSSGRLNPHARRALTKLREKRENAKEIIHELALMKYTVDVFRKKYHRIPEYWTEQESMAIVAVTGWKKVLEEEFREIGYEATGGIHYDTLGDFLETEDGRKWRDSIEGPEVSSVKRGNPGPEIVWQCQRGFLTCKLPSGRLLWYKDPEIKQVKTPWGERRPELRYWSVDGVTRTWSRTATYGGKLVENITQAVARDAMVDAILEAEGWEGYEMLGDMIITKWGTPSKYELVLSVHDELGSEVDKDEGSFEEFEGIMSGLGTWADGCPITAEAARFERYRKA